MYLGQALDANGNILQKIKFEPLASDPNASLYLGSLSGAIYYNTTSGVNRIHNGSEWVDIVKIQGAGNNITVTYSGNPLVATINLSTTGTSGTYTKVTTDAYGRVTAGTTLTSGDIPTLPATKIGTGIIDDTEFNYLNGVSANIQNQLTNLSGTTSQINTTLLSAGNWSSSFATVQSNSANWQTAYTNNHAHGNKANLDFINQNLNTSASVSFSNISASSITVGNVSNTEFGYLDGTSANIQNQLTSLSADRLFATNGVDNRIATFSNSNTLNGEANLTFDGNTDLSIDAATSPRINLNTTSVSGNTVGIRLRHNSSNKWYVGTDNDSADYVILDYATSNRDIKITSGSTGVITLGSNTKKVNLPSLSTSAVVVTDGSKNLVSSPVTTTELSYLTGATSNIQTQLNNMATTVGLSAYQLRSEKGASLGYAALDSNSKIYTSSIPDAILGQLHYSGTWNATTNSPTLPAPNTVSGAFYIVTVSGTSIPNGLNPNTSASIFSGTNKWFVGDWIVSDGTYWDKIDNTDSISTWNGRTGAIVPVAGDYTATQITNTPAGNLTATDVQAALNELDSEKVAKTTTITAGTGLTGGGDLSTNRTLSLATTGTSGTYTKVTTDAYGRVTAGTTLTSGDIPTIPATKIGSGLIDDTEFNYLNGVSANIQSQLANLSGTTAQINSSLTSAALWNSSYTTVQSNSANWQTAYTSAHFHTNKTNLDLINQNLNTSSSPQFVKVNATSGFTVDNSYGSGNGLLYGNGDSANYTTNNIKLASWYGIGIWSSLNNNYTGYINTRTGALTMSGAITSDTSVNAPTMNEGGISLSAKYAPYSTYTTVQSNSADWNLNNITFRENVNAGYSRIATFTNTTQGDTENIRILFNGYINDSRKGSFDINFGATQVPAMSATASTPILKVVANDNTTWSFGYTIDVDTSAAKTYTLWAYNGNSYAYLRGSVVSKRPYNTTIYTKDTPQAGLPSGYTASSYSDTRLNSITVDVGITSLALTGVGGNVSYLDAAGKLQRSATTTTELTNIRGADTAIVYSNPGETGYIEFGSFTLTAATSSSVFYIDQTILVESYEMGYKESAIFHVDIRRNGWSGIVGGIRVLSKTYSNYLDADWLTILSTDPLSATTMTFKVCGKIPASGYFRWRTTRLGGRSLIDTYANFGMSSYPRTIVSALPSPTASFTSLYQPDITHVVKNPTGDQTISGGYLRIQQTSASNIAFGAFVAGDSASRWFAYADGKMEWGPGNAGRDTDLYRAGVGILKTTSDFTTLGKLEVGNVTTTADFDLLSFKTEREWSFRKQGAGANTSLNLLDATGGKWFNIGMTNYPTVEIATNDVPANRIFKATGQIYFNSLSGSGNQIPYLDSTGRLLRTTTTSAELGYLAGTSANIQTQINNIRNGSSLRYSTSINISAGTQSFTINHNLGYLRPNVRIFDEVSDREIIVTPVFVSTSQLTLPITSSQVFSGAVVEVSI